MAAAGAREVSTQVRPRSTRQRTLPTPMIPQVRRRDEPRHRCRVDSGPVAGETVYFLLEGQLTIEAEGQEATLGPCDTAYLPNRTVRSLCAGDAPASVLVARSN